MTFVWASVRHRRLSDTMFADSPVCSLRYPHEGPLARAFGVLDPGGRTRTGTTRMDSPVLYQLSYPGVVTKVYAGKR
jgi:hypothetical protein